MLRAEVSVELSAARLGDVPDFEAEAGSPRFMTGPCLIDNCISQAHSTARQGNEDLLIFLGTIGQKTLP